MTAVTRLLPGPAESRDADDPETRDWLAELYAPAAPSSVRLNFVASINGSVVGQDGTSESLSSRLDRRILGVIRQHADVVLVGARTVRREGYLAPKHARLAVVTRSGDLTGHRLGETFLRPLILCPEAAIPLVRRQMRSAAVEIVPLRSSTPDPVEVLGALRDRGLPGVVCEGGPTLAGSLLDAGLVDELCLTTSPMLHAPGLPLLPGLRRTLPASLRSLLADDGGYLYARWGLERGQAAG
ncbi:dihydrofolate reductase family protein [Naasia sp. SYSU D00948]|uniref:dihydrofolate reductase family protein n=1 Tax=Naasia sp. SYSU D00948 TaxID=2817379 RepID=UPI001B30C7F8|nr:dihydrofolate reductase family protein [Naasia sp. SYSU D00948]